MNSKQSCIQHKQVPAKVTVYVDEGIKELVEVLNMIPGVCTLDSCEGSLSHWASVSLEYGVDYTNGDALDLHALTEFADKLWQVIKDAEFKGKVPAGTMECISLQIEWHPRYHPILLINVAKQYIPKLVSILRPLCNDNRSNRQQSKCANLCENHR